MHNLRLDLEDNKLNTMRVWKITIQCQHCNGTQSLKGKKKDETLSTGNNFCTLCKLHEEWIIRKIIYTKHKFLRIPMGIQSISSFNHQNY